MPNHGADNDPVQQVIDEATDLLQSLSLDDIVSDRIAMVADVAASGEYINSNLEVMDLAIKNLLARDLAQFRTIADRLLAEDSSDLQDSGARMLVQIVQQTGDSGARETLERALVNHYTHVQAIELLLDATDAGPRAVIEVMMHLVLYYKGGESPA